MAAIDHQYGLHTYLPQLLPRLFHTLRVVVGTAIPAAQPYMAPWIARRAHDAGLALLIDTYKSVRLAGRLQSIDGDLHVTLSGVFKPYRHREPAGHFTVDLTLGGARSNRRPGDEIGVVLRRDGVEQLRPNWQPHGVNVEQEPARQAQPRLHIIGAVEMGIIGEPLPANGSAWFFKIDTHHHAEAVGEFLAQGVEAASILEGRLRIVDGAGANNH